MAADSGRNPRLGRVMLVAAAAMPPVVGAAGSWGTVQQHPVPYLAALVLYEALVLAAVVVAEAYGELKKRWSAGLTDAIDAALRRRFSRYGRRYRRFLVAAHRDVDLRGPAPRGSLTMDRVFVDVGLVPCPADAVQAPGAGQVTGHREIWEFLRGTPLAVLGASGGGKTTLLKHITLVLARNPRAGWPIGAPRHKTPILLFLREHAAAIAADPAISLAEIVRRAAQPSGAKEPPHWFDRQLETGRGVVLLDGLDEIARKEDRRLVVDWVQRQIYAYPCCPFVLTSRPYGYRTHPLDAATVLQVRPFTPAQVSRFVDGWYAVAGRDGPRGRASEGSGDLLDRLRDHPELYELATSPLLLTMIANVHLYRGTLPGGAQVDLYREISTVLLARRRTAAGLAGDLTADQTEIVLRVLALAMMEREVSDVTLTEAADLVSPSLAAVRPQMDPQDVLRSVEQSTGLILERENGVCSFAHQTLQEYFAAAYLLESGDPGVLLRNLDRGWWGETTLLYAAQADASPLVAACLGSGGPSAYRLDLAERLTEVAGRLDPDLRRRVTDLRGTEPCADARSQGSGGLGDLAGGAP